MHSKSSVYLLFKNHAVIVDPGIIFNNRNPVFIRFAEQIHSDPVFVKVYGFDIHRRSDRLDFMNLARSRHLDKMIVKQFTQSLSLIFFSHAEQMEYAKFSVCEKNPNR